MGGCAEPWEESSMQLEVFEPQAAQDNEIKYIRVDVHTYTEYF